MKRLLALLGLGLLGAIVAGVIEGRSVRLKRTDIWLSGLPPALDGFTIAQLSDLHVDEYMTDARLGAGLEMLMSVQPDLIVMTGDLTTDAGVLERLLPAFRRLSAPHGVYAILGNHEHWSGEVDRVQRIMEGAGFRWLVNEGVALQVDDSQLWLCGVDDAWAGHPDLARALADSPASAFPVLLSHAPDFADLAAASPVRLQLSGHSHGGQIAPFGIIIKVVPGGQHYPRGLQRVTDRLQVYTSVGFGLGMIPIRLGAPPEVAILTLRCEPAP